MVKRYVWDEEGYPPDGMELVSAADYDALAARIRELEAAIADIRARHEWFASHKEGSREALDSAQMDRGMLLDCIPELEAALVAATELLNRNFPLPYDPKTYAPFYEKWNADRAAWNATQDRGGEHG